MRRLGSEELNHIAASLAYRFFLALFPFFIFVVAVSSVVAGALGVRDPVERMLVVLGDVPIGVADVLRAEFRAVLEAEQPGLVSAGILGAVWAATAGMSAFIQAMDRAYRVPETRSAVRRFLLSLGLTLVAGTGIVGAFLLLMISEVAGPRIERLLGLIPYSQALLSPMRWVVLGMVVVLAASTLYRFAPNVYVPWRRALPGALLFTGGWSIATYAFSLYVGYFGSFAATYGTLGGAAILLIWFYVSSLLLLVGAELNAVLDEDRLALGSASREASLRHQPEGHPDGLAGGHQGA